MIAQIIAQITDGAAQYGELTFKSLLVIAIVALWRALRLCERDRVQIWKALAQHNPDTQVPAWAKKKIKQEQDDYLKWGRE